MAQEMQTLAALDAKQNKLFKGQKNFVSLKKEVNDMYAVLEENYDDTQITSMQNNLKMKQQILTDLNSEVKTRGNIANQKRIILDEVNKVSENQDKIDSLNTMIAHATIHYKKMRLDSLEDQKLVKKQHEQALRKEDVCKKVATSIKKEKAKKANSQKDGDKYLNPQQMVESMNKKVE